MFACELKNSQKSLQKQNSSSSLSNPHRKCTQVFSQLLCHPTSDGFLFVLWLPMV